jgi:hypothetical protein
MCVCVCVCVYVGGCVCVCRPLDLCLQLLLAEHLWGEDGILA